MTDRKPFRWHILVFLAPAVLVYTALMIVPLFGTLNLALYRTADGVRGFVGLDNFRTLFGDPRWSSSFWNALGNNVWFFLIHMLVQNPIGVALAALLSSPRLRGAAFYRTAIFIPTILSFVIVGFVWKLILSPIWGIAPGMLGERRAQIALRSLARPGGDRAHHPRPDLGLAVRRHPDDADLRSTALDPRRGHRGRRDRRHHRLGAVLEDQAAADPAGDRHHLDPDLRRQLQRLRPDLRLQGALAGPNFSTDILGTFLYRTFFGFQLQIGDPHMGAAIATAMFFIILAGVAVYLFAIQRRLRRYQF